MSVSKEQIESAIKEYIDPYLEKDLVTAGAVKDTAIDGDRVKVKVVLGYPAYYSRFGFVPAVEFNLRSEYDVPDDVFMVLELVPGSLKGVSGTVKYHHAFAEV